LQTLPAEQQNSIDKKTGGHLFMQNHFEWPLFLPVRPSSWLTAGLYLAHSGAILALVASSVPMAIQLPIIAGLLASLARVHRLFVSRTSPRSAVQLVLNPADEWVVGLANGENVTATLKPMAFVHPLLVVMSFQAVRQTYRIILTPDTVDPDSFRRLRVRLRFKSSDES
jgi:hypothetical protein